ncbi:MAG: MFS transporter [Hyphomicrobiales bacterium]|nr:MFS transporter [Hyphomicrobiales bacterium]
MLARSLAAALDRRNIHYGWVIVVTAFFSSLVMAGAVGLPGALIKPLTTEFGWDAAQISSALAVRFVLFGLMAPFSAALIDRYGVRRVILSAQMLVFTGLMAALFITSLWQLILFWGIFVGVGTGLTALVLNAILSTRWFTARRGLVMGMLTAAIATGQLVFLPVGAWLVDHYGWRWALAPLGIGIVLAAIAVTLFLVDYPSEVGLKPYGETGPVTAPPPRQEGALGAAALRAVDILRECVRAPAFWLLAGSFFICGLSTNGLIQTHFISFCVDNGMAAVTAASALAMMGVFDLFGTIGSGWLSDRYDARKLLFVYYGFRGLSLLWLPSSTFTLYGLSVFAMFYGLDWIATVPPTVKLVGAQFGREKAGVAFGWIFAAHQLGAASAAMLGGLSRTWLLTYAPSFYLAGFACLLAAIFSLMIGRGGARKATPAMA